MKLHQTKDGTILEVFVKPKAPEFEVLVEADEIVVRSTEEPEKGKANKEIIKELSRLFHARVEIISGKTSKKKILYVQGKTKSEMETILQSKKK